MTDSVLVAETTEPDIPCSSASCDRIRFMDETKWVEGATANADIVEVLIEERDWDVTDSQERRARAEAALGGPVDPFYFAHAMWYIDEEKNAAGLCVFRKKTPANAWTAAA